MPLKKKKEKERKLNTVLKGLFIYRVLGFTRQMKKEELIRPSVTTTLKHSGTSLYFPLNFLKESCFSSRKRVQVHLLL